MKSIMSILVLVSFFLQTTAYAAVPFKVDGLRSNGNVEVNGSVSVGTGAAPNSKAILDLTSTTKGILPPRMTTAQRTAISSPPTGLVVYDTDTLTVWQYNGAGWIEVGSGGTSGAQYNVIENFGFEATTYNEDWTASGGVVAEATGTNIIFGAKSATWDASASTQTFSYASQAIGQGYKNNNCEGALFIQTPSGTATHTLQVWDGTNVLASVTVYSTTTPREFSTGAFPCPSSGNWQLRLLANADEPLIAVDNAFLGLFRGVGTVAQAFYKGSISMSGCTDWSRSNGAFGDFTATAGCTYSVTGDVLAPSTFIPGFRLQNVAPGRYLIIARGYFGKTVTTTNADVSFRFSDGTSTFAEQVAVAAASSSGQSIGVGELTGSIGYTTAQGTLTFQIQGQVSNTASSTAAVISDDAGANATGEITGLQFEVFYFPTQSQQVVMPNQQRPPKITRYTSGSGTHTWSSGVTYATVRMVGGGGGGGGSGSASATAGGAGGNTTFGSYTATGGAGGTAGTNVVIGAGAAATSAGCTISESVLCIAGGAGGSGLVTGSGAATLNANGGPGGVSPFGGNSGMRYQAASVAAATNSGSGGNGGHGNAGITYPGGGGAAGAYYEIRYDAPVGTASYGVGASGTAGGAGTSGYAGSAGGSGFIEVTEYFGYTTAILANSVTTANTNGDKILRATINCDAASTVVRSNDSSVSVGNISSGSCAVSWSASTFSGSPVCTVTNKGCSAPSGTRCFDSITGGATTTGMTTSCISDAGGTCTVSDYDFICIGPR